MGVALDQDIDLVVALRAGSADAFADLVRRHQEAVRAFLGSYLRDQTAVDDLAQETFLSAYRDLHTFSGGSRFLTWLLGISRHRALEHLRAHRRRHARVTSAWELARTQRIVGLLETDNFADAARERELSAMKSCVEKLAPHSAALVTEHYFRSRPLVDIAKETGKKESTVRVELLRIRTWLRRCIETSLGQGALL